MILTATTGGAAVLAADWKPTMLEPGLYLAGALLLGAMVIALVKRWHRRAEADELTPSDQLARYRSLYEEGTISQEEYERLRALLGGQLRQSLGGPTRPAVQPGEVRAEPKEGVVPDAPPPLDPPTDVRPA